MFIEVSSPIVSHTELPTFFVLRLGGSKIIQATLIMENLTVKARTNQTCNNFDDTTIKEQMSARKSVITSQLPFEASSEGMWYHNLDREAEEWGIVALIHKFTSSSCCRQVLPERSIQCQPYPQRRR